MIDYLQGFLLQPNQPGFLQLLLVAPRHLHPVCHPCTRCTRWWCLLCAMPRLHSSHVPLPQDLMSPSLGTACGHRLFAAKP